jgi:hypothetical protein
VPLFQIFEMGRPLKKEESQKTCLRKKHQNPVDKG